MIASASEAWLNVVPIQPILKRFAAIALTALGRSMTVSHAVWLIVPIIVRMKPNTR